MLQFFMRPNYESYEVKDGHKYSDKVLNSGSAIFDTIVKLLFQQLEILG